MMQGVLTHTLAALGYALVTLFPHHTPNASLSPVGNSIQEYVYVVKSGETLTDIAEKVYGSKDYWTSIWNDNPSVINPSILQSGTRLRIRYTKPLLVENVSSERIAEVVNQPSNPPLDSSLAFAVAGDSATLQQTLPQAKSVLPAPTAAPAQAIFAVASSQAASIPTPPSNYDDVYKAAGDRYGVPWQILYGIHLTETGLRNGPISNHQGSGAQGPMQFMPGTFNAYAVDGDGDGMTDINDATDAIYTAANFIAKHGGVMPGLYSYGGNTSGTLAAACQRGYCQ